MPETMYILTVGDSVTWGQGLRPSQKMSTLVQDAFKPRMKTRALMLAHSGAVIGVGASFNQPECDPEVPKGYPTILQQIDRAPDQDVTLLLVNGGINDINIRVILNPFTDRRRLVDLCKLHCGAHMTVLLDRALRKFPSARIVVTSYYPILSPESDIDLIPGFMAMEGVPVAPLFEMYRKGPVLRKIVDNCRIFFEESSLALKAAVEAHAAGGRVFFAAPPFRDENAALAPKPWLFGLNSQFGPEDPVAGRRRKACDACEKDLLQREQCYRASAGHPNAEGARQFANAILEALD